MPSPARLPRATPCALRWRSDPTKRKSWWWGRFPAGWALRSRHWPPGNTLAELGGDWTLDLNGKQVTTPLKSWEALGTHRLPGRPRIASSSRPRLRRRASGVSGNRRCARLRQGEAERERVGGPRLAAVSLGCDQRGEGGRERSGSGSAHDGERAGIWRSASGSGGGGRRGSGSRRPRRQGARRGGRAGAAGGFGGGRGRGNAPPPVSGLLGPVRLVAR
jgi:hypothetical protein